MKTEKLNSWLTLGANVGVLIGLILLVIELRQNTEMMQVQMMQSRAEGGSELLRVIMDSPYIPPIHAKLGKNEELSEEEMIRYRYYFRSAFRWLDNAYWQYTQNLLEEEVARSVSATSKNIILQGEIGLELWDQLKYEHTDEFVAFIEEAIADLR